MKNRGRGFTLLEMMITVAIIALLAAIAYPSYMDSIRKSRRADAMDAVLYVQQLQEKYRANNPDFGSLTEIGYPNGGVPPVYSTDGYYTITTTGPSNATAYTVTAAAVAGKSQAADTGCTSLTLTVSAANPKGVKAPATCWRN